MTVRASILAWSAGSGVLLGLCIDAALIGLWALATLAVPALAPRHLPRWLSGLLLVLLASVPVATGILGYLEGRLKVN